MAPRKCVEGTFCEAAKTVQTALERYNLSYMGAPSTEAVGEGASAAGEEEVRSRKARQQAAQLWRP